MRFLLFLALLVVAWPTQAYENAYAKFLVSRTRVDQVGDVRTRLVDYENGQRDLSLLKTALALEKAEDHPSEAHQMAFYINAYNILAMAKVAEHWPVDSIKDIGSFLAPVWRHKAGRLFGEEVSLHDIEHRILRPMGEPRIHMAIVCASLSCPSLHAWPFTADELDEQLDIVSREFLLTPTKGARIENDRIRLSRIFDWFETDFRDIASFLRRYRPEIPDLPIKADLPYDWSVNAVSRLP